MIYTQFIKIIMWALHSYKKPLLKRIESIKKKYPIFLPNIHINTRLKPNSLVVFIKICMIHPETLLHFTGNWEKQQYAVCRISWNFLRWLVRLRNLSVFLLEGECYLTFWIYWCICNDATIHSGINVWGFFLLSFH